MVAKWRSMVVGQLEQRSAAGLHDTKNGGDSSGGSGGSGSELGTQLSLTTTVACAGAGLHAERLCAAIALYPFLSYFTLSLCLSLFGLVRVKLEVAGIQLNHKSFFCNHQSELHALITCIMIDE